MMRAPGRLSSWSPRGGAASVGRTHGASGPRPLSQRPGQVQAQPLGRLRGLRRLRQAVPGRGTRQARRLCLRPAAARSPVCRPGLRHQRPLLRGQMPKAGSVARAQSHRGCHGRSALDGGPDPLHLVHGGNRSCAVGRAGAPGRRVGGWLQSHPLRFSRPAGGLDPPPRSTPGSTSIAATMGVRKCTSIFPYMAAACRSDR